MKHPLDDFIAEVRPLVTEGLKPAELVLRVEPLVRTLVSTPGWLKPEYRAPIPEKPYAQYLLYRPDDLSFSIVSFVWNAGQGSLVHDHCTWGVIGQYEGHEEETRFRRTDDGTRDGFAELEPVSTHTFRPGEVAHVYPPDRDVHRILNNSDSPTISIHIYGGDIGTQRRHSFNLDNGRVQEFVSGYDVVPGSSAHQSSKPRSHSG